MALALFVAALLLVLLLSYELKRSLPNQRITGRSAHCITHCTFHCSTLMRFCIAHFTIIWWWPCTSHCAWPVYCVTFGATHCVVLTALLVARLRGLAVAPQ